MRAAPLAANRTVSKVYRRCVRTGPVFANTRRRSVKRPSPSPPDARDANPSLLPAFAVPVSGHLSHPGHNAACQKPVSRVTLGVLEKSHSRLRPPPIVGANSLGSSVVTPSIRSELPLLPLRAHDTRGAFRHAPAQIKTAYEMIRTDSVIRLVIAAPVAFPSCAYRHKRVRLKGHPFHISPVNMLTAYCSPRPPRPPPPSPALSRFLAGSVKNPKLSRPHCIKKSKPTWHHATLPDPNMPKYPRVPAWGAFMRAGPFFLSAGNFATRDGARANASFQICP